MVRPVSLVIPCLFVCLFFKIQNSKLYKHINDHYTSGYTDYADCKASLDYNGNSPSSKLVISAKVGDRLQSP